MNDYSYNDILRMQDEAKKRVLEMQKRSRAAADNFNNGSRINAQVHPTEKEELPRVPRAISYPAQLQSQHDKNVRNPGKGKSNGAAGFDIKNALYSVFGNLSEDEYEKMFILSLCLLLAEESRDDSLIFALMYLLT